MLSKESESFLALIRLGVGHLVYVLPDKIDWMAIQNIAERNGLSAIVLDGIDKLPPALRPPQEMLLEWIGGVLQEYEQRYVQYQKAIKGLAKFYNEHGFKLMLLKGYGLSLNYPKPDHRPCGDIDIWAFGQQKEADEALCLWRKKLGNKLVIDDEHHHHTVFNWMDFTVENHYDFLNVHYGHRNDSLEAVLKDKAADDSHTVDVEGQNVYLPSANLHALFVLRHMLHNFASTGVNVRQILDWAFLIEKQGKDIDWNWLHQILKEYHMMNFFNLINAICVEDFGFDSRIFPTVQFLPALKDRVLSDILSPEFSGKTPRFFLSRAIFKYRRWQANAWKQDLCYADSRWKAFWQGVWGHLVKPSMI